MFMDFSAEATAELGRGRYISLDPAVLPPLWLIYRREREPGDGHRGCELGAGGQAGGQAVACVQTSCASRVTAGHAWPRSGSTFVLNIPLRCALHPAAQRRHLARTAAACMPPSSSCGWQETQLCGEG